MLAQLINKFHANKNYQRLSKVDRVLIRIFFPFCFLCIAWGIGQAIYVISKDVFILYNFLHSAMFVVIMIAYAWLMLHHFTKQSSNKS
jgi:hypothetical protein